MRTSLKNIEDIIKSVVAYYVKEWCADIHYDGSLKLLPLHPLAVAKHIALTYMGSNANNMYKTIKTVTAHMRTYSNIMELNPEIANNIPRIISDFESNNSDTDFGHRYVELNEKKTDIGVLRYFSEHYADDSVILFLIENSKDTKFADDNNRVYEDELIKNGFLLAAVEMRCSVPFRTYMDYPQITPGLFRCSFKENQEAGLNESAIYKNTVSDNIIWTSEAIRSVVQLFQQYALQNIDDTKFMHEITTTLPEPVIFKSRNDYYKYTEMMGEIKEVKKNYDYTVIKL